jgi:hypothetical protein
MLTGDVLHVGLAALAVWRVTHLLAAEDGPGSSVARLRAAAGDGLWGQALDCFLCLSLWVALPVAAGFDVGWADRALLWPALSGAACLLERIGDRSGRDADAVPPARYYEGTEEKEHVLLRTTTPSGVLDRET